MSTRPTPNTHTPRTASATAANADRLSQVLAAGLERQLSLKTCRPCKQQPVQRLRQAAAPTDLVVDYESEEQLRAAGARRLELDDGVPYDPISFDDFERADGRERNSSRVMILGCGHAFTLRTVQRHNQGRLRSVCPRMREHQTADGNYYLTAVERAELGLTPNPFIGVDGLIREPQSDGSVKVYSAEVLGRVLVRIEYEGGVEYYDGPRGEERLVRRTYSDGQTEFLEGQRYQERVVRTTFADGQIQFYEGPRDQEHVVRKTFPDGKVVFYEGRKGAERKVRKTFPNGAVVFYEGERGQERKVRVEFLNGSEEFYEGERNQERKVRVMSAYGHLQFYEGERDEEHLVRIEFLNGNVRFFEGPRDEERMVAQ